MVVVCRVELAVYLLQRVLRRGKDDRFDNVRGHFVSFLVFWILQSERGGVLWAVLSTPSLLPPPLPQ